MADEKITVAARDGKRFDAFVSLPPSGTGRGLLVLPEIYNSNDHIRAVAQGFAAEGFVTLAPDVFWRLEPGTYLPYTPEGQAKARALNQRLDTDVLVDDLGQCLAALRDRAECTGKLTYLCAARHTIDAAASYYGVKIDTYLDEADAVSCPILLHFAEHDSHVPAETVETIRTRMGSRANVAIHIYDGAEHGFNRRGYPPYQEAAAGLAMSRTLDHFRRHLA